MKILIICDIFDASISSQENILVKYYLRHGHEVTVLTSTTQSVFDYIADRFDRDAPESCSHIDGAKVIRMPYRYNLLNRVKPFRDVDRVLNDEQPDLVFMMDIIPNMREVVRYKKAHPKSRFVMDYHADSTNSGKNWLSRRILHGVIRKRQLDSALPHLDAIYPVVPASATFLENIYRIDRARLELLPLGADMEVGLQVKRGREGRALRRQMGIGADEFVIFTGGKFAPLKRTEILVDAVREMGQPAPHLIIVGSANRGHEAYEAQLRDRAAGNDHIHFVGWLANADLFRHMDMADVAMFPASQSILWVQAVSMGLPLIVGDLGGQDISYMNLHQNILTVPREQIAAGTFAELLAELRADPDRLARMGAGAERVYDEVLDWNKLIWKTMGLAPPNVPEAAGAAAES